MSLYPRSVVVAAAALLFSAPSFASELFRGDFETGNLSQWSSVESSNPSHIGVVTDPVAQGTYAMKVVLAPGDIIFSGTRNEVDDERDNPKEGEERYYHWRTLFPADFQTVSTWEVFTQWHHYSGGGSPPVEFDVASDKLSLLTQGDVQHWSTPLVRGVWHDFVFHVRWSSDPTVGFIELTYDGQQVLPKKLVATLYPGDTVYLKQGLYRDSNSSLTQTAYHDGMVVGTTLQDVAWGGSTGSPDGGSGTTDAGTPSSGGSSGGSSDAGTPTSGGNPGGSSGTPTSPSGSDAGTALTGGSGSGNPAVASGCAALPSRSRRGGWLFVAGPLALAALIVRRRRRA